MDNNDLLQRCYDTLDGLVSLLNEGDDGTAMMIAEHSGDLLADLEKALGK